MNEIISLDTFVAALLAVVTFVVSLQVLRGHPTLSSPMISVCVGILSFLGLLALPGPCASMILIAYASLAVSLFILLCLFPFLHFIVHKKPHAPKNHDIKRCQEPACRATKTDQHENQERKP